MSLARVKGLADENFDARILRGLAQRLPWFDIVRVQDVGLVAAADPDVLAWAATNDRVVMTHDVTTMIGFAATRLRTGQSLPGLLVVPSQLSISEAIADLALLVECTTPQEMANRILFVPL